MKNETRERASHKLWCPNFYIIGKINFKEKRVNKLMFKICQKCDAKI